MLDVGEVFVKSKDILKPEDGNINWDAELSGLLTNESGEVMVGFDLEILYGNKTFSDVTDINGRYEFAGLPRDKKVKLGLNSVYRVRQREKTRLNPSFTNIFLSLKLVLIVT